MNMLLISIGDTLQKCINVAHINIGKKNGELFSGMNELVKGIIRSSIFLMNMIYEEMRSCIKEYTI